MRLKGLLPLSLLPLVLLLQQPRPLVASAGFTGTNAGPSLHSSKRDARGSDVLKSGKSSLSKITDDGMSSSRSGAGPILLYTTRNEVRSVDVSKPGKSTIIAKNLEENPSVDFYDAEQRICWTDSVAEKINCMFHNGTHSSEKPDIVLSGITPNGLSIDWYTKKIYWTDTRIEVVSIGDNNYRKVLFWSDIDQPRAIALAPMKGLLFWTDWGEVAKIERAGMNGDPATRTVIVHENIFWPNGLTIDYKTNKIYWLDAKLNFIDVMNFDGGERSNIMKNLLTYPFALSIFNAKLYWTDWKTWYIYSWDINTKGPIRNIVHSEEVINDVKVWDGLRQPTPNISHPCMLKNGNCSHLCLLSPNFPGYSCACPTGIKLINDFTCAIGPQAQLILVQKMAISRISLDTPDYTSFVLPLRNIKRAVTVDYDPVEGYIYWSDSEARTISRSKIDGSNQSVIIQGDLSNPDGLVIDSVARNIYWTDPSADTITTARLDGSSRKVLINEDLESPRAIALAPSLGWMFWSDWSKHRIERASLDGSDRTILVSTDLGWPNGIALDIQNQKIYWGDGFLRKIEVCNMNGSDRRELVSDNLYHIFGISLLGNYIYWTDWQRRSLSRVHKNTGGERVVIVDQFPGVMGLKTFELNQEQIVNSCSYNNGNCSHFCFNRPNDFVCGCPIGLEFGKDNKTCVKAAAFLLYARKDKIGRLSIENPNNYAFLPIKDIKNPSALTIHAADGRLYWTESKFRSIGRCAINGSNAERVIEWTYGVESLALDWCGRNLYWTDSSANRIEVSSLNGSNRRTLIWQGLRKPTSIALDPMKGFMYWSESKCIKRAGMDGSYPTILIDQVTKAQAINIDYEKGRLIWGILDPPMIEISNLDGRERTTLISENIVMPVSVTFYQDQVFWADWTTGNIGSALINNSANVSILYSKLDFISDMVVYHESRQIGANPCSTNNGGCSHLCLSVPGTSSSIKRNVLNYKCACPTHYTLKEDNHTCSAPSEFIMFIHRNSIGRVIMGGQDCPDASLPIPGLRSVRAIEYDPLHKHIYWIDGRTHSIRYLPENGGGEVTVVAKGLDISVDIALDAIGRAIYFSCPESNTINVTRLDNNTSSVGVVIHGEGIIPRHVVIHQTKRILFWVDKNKGAIMSSALDGSDRLEIGHGPNISALTLDPYTDTLYFANAKQIYATTINGSNNRIIWQGGNVMSLAVLKSTLYWIDGEKQLMYLPLHKKDAPARPVLPTLRSVPSITDVVAVYKIDTKHPCMGGGECSGVCLANGKCGCARGLSQGGDGRCSLPPPCGAHHFACTPNQSSHTIHLADKTLQRDCIPIDWRCDGQNDCPNGSDEEGCNPCQFGKFKCPDDQCIEKSQVCDGIKQCSDGRDESHCCSDPNNFQCPGTEICVQANHLCDQFEQRAESQQSGMKTLYVFGFIGLVTTLSIMLGTYYCRKKICKSNHYLHNDKAADPLSPKLTSHMHKSGTICPSTSNSRATKMGIKIIEGMRMSSLNESSTNSYDRNHITGASSSGTNGSSFVSRYPREPLNPPPSPATTAPSSSAPSRHRPYRHYRVINQPPPPTPCSTDVCDESDCTISYPTLGFGTYLEAPPPTPCPPSPPSPSSRSSTYFSPLPPPPSPVPHHYDS